MSFFSISLLEEGNEDDQLHTIIKYNIQYCKQVQTFFRNCSLLKFLLRSRKDKTWFTSLFNTEVPIRIHDHLSFIICPDNNEEGKVSAVCPADDHLYSFYTLDWYEEVLVSISVFSGDSGMTSEGNFNVYLCP